MPALPCPLLAHCPGCSLGALPYEQGLAAKGARLARALAPFSELEPSVLAARAASPTLAYRLRAKLVCEGRSLGLYERGSHRVVDVSPCLVLAESLVRTASALRQALPLPIYGADLRETSQGVLVTLLLQDARARPQLERFAAELVASGAAHSVALALRPHGNRRVLAGTPVLVAGPELARHQLAEGTPYTYAAHGSFVQAHAGQASYVCDSIVSGLKQRLGSLENRRVLELFAGSGGLSLALARAGARVVAVEAFAPASERCQRAAREQGVALEAVAADATRYLEQHARGDYAAIVVNPPRRGLQPGLRRALGRAAPAALAYVSCSPSTLARDLSHLRLLGLAARQLEPLDMIPWSDAVEALTWLEPAPPPAPRVLLEDEHWLAVDRSAHERLLPEASGAPSLLTRLRQAGYPEAEPVEPNGSAASGVTWFAKAASGVAELQRALARAERQQLLLVRGNLRKQGTLSRRAVGGQMPGVRYRKVEACGRHSLVRVVAPDADENQLLRDFAGIGHPVLGSELHGEARSNEYLEHRHGLDRPFLHTERVRLQTSPGAVLEVESELSPDLAQVLESLRSD